MRISMRGSGVAAGMTALLAALSLTGCGSASSAYTDGNTYGMPG